MRTLFIGSRPTALEACLSSRHVDVTTVIGVELQGGPELPTTTDLHLVSARTGKQDALRLLHAADYELLVSAGCPWRLPVDELPPDRTYINCHPSALPLGRGRHPINEALIADHRTAGVTVHHMDRGIDTGPIIASSTFHVTDDLDAAILYAVLFDLEAEVLSVALERVAQGGSAARGVPQSGPTTTYSRPPERPCFDASMVNAATVVDHARAWMLHGGVEVRADRRRFSVTRAAQMSSNFIIDWLSGSPSGSVCLEAPGVLIIRTTDGLLRLIDYSEIS
jgi:methionyl-tRNA formyltransferase